MKIRGQACLNGLVACVSLLTQPVLMRGDLSIKERLEWRVNRVSDANREMVRIIRIKGLRMRIDNESERNSWTIYDLERGKRFRVRNSTKNEVFVTDLSQASKQMQEQVVQRKLSRDVRPNGKTFKILGRDCEEYMFDLQAPYRMGTTTYQLQDRGSVCASLSTTEGVEFSNFIHEAMKRGYIRAVLPISPTMSAIGPYFFGDEPNVLVLGTKTESGLDDNVVRHMANERTTTVIEIRSEPIPDEDFQIPVNWRQRKDDELH